MLTGESIIMGNPVDIKNHDLIIEGGDKIE